MGLLAGLAVLLRLRKVTAEEATAKKQKDSPYKSPLQEMFERAGAEKVVSHASGKGDVAIAYQPKRALKQYHLINVDHDTKVNLTGWPLLAVLDENPSMMYVAVRFPPRQRFKIEFDPSVWWLGHAQPHQLDLSQQEGDVVILKLWSWGDSVVYGAIEK